MMTRKINLKQLQLASGAIALVGVCLGVYSALKTDNLNLRSLSLFGATASVLSGIVGYTSLILGEDSANRQIGDIVESQKEAVHQAKRLKEDNSKLSASIKGIQDKHEDLIASWNSLKGTADELEGNSQKLVQNAKQFLIEHLATIHRHLESAVQTGIRKNRRDTKNNEDHKQHVEQVLKKRSFDLEADIKKWADWVETIDKNNLLEIYLQVLDEISTHKSKIANSSTRLNYHAYIPQGYLHKDNALKLNDEYHSVVINKINEYDSVAADNGEFLAAAGRDIELLKARLVEQNTLVEELRQPITWKFALNHATRVGNLVIEYCKGNGLHLDRSHYTGDAYEVDLFFFTDRISAAQTVDIKALNNEGERLAQITHCQEPINFSYQYETRLLVAHAVLQQRVVEKKQPSNPVDAVKQFVKPVEALLPFIEEAYHVGLWASTGGGKTTAISNIVGGLIQALGGNPIIRLTVPKIDADTQALFPEVHWLGLQESIFGLLEAAVEIQFRIWRNEQAYRAKEVIQDYQPTLFFIDEINTIFTRWKKINENDLNDVLDRFEGTLVGDRLRYFRSWMRLELTNYKEQFASKLLLFIWQTGRSLRVKSLIAGQNLMPSKLGLTINDLDNCSYISFGDSIKGCSKYKVRDVDIDLISKQYNLLQKAVEMEDNLKYTALYCPSVGKSFFGILPPPNYYQWDANLINPRLALASPPTQPTTTHANKAKIAETVVAQSVDSSLPQKTGNLTTQPMMEGNDSKSCEAFSQRGFLAKKYQNLDFKGYADLLASLPKKPDGSVHKVQAYEIIFKVWKKDLRKIYSSFIDWLETNFK